MRKESEDSRQVVNHSAHDTSERQTTQKELIPVDTFHNVEKGIDINQNHLLTPICPSKGAQEREVLEKTEAEGTSRGNRGSTYSLTGSGSKGVQEKENSALEEITMANKGVTVPTSEKAIEDSCIKEPPSFTS
ncbi:uncharacterized protein G2W53_000855 [Senna tora]|uniref:Uncharacterized protein n=1 Tax=Senna tora TaxID=362788 RepID=A0A834XGE7_9FABA|nr:uncharacterized protein G2W53_000855 [Senna tora]